MTEQDIDKHFKGLKWHHFLIYFPAGALFSNGLLGHNWQEAIGAVLILVGGILQGQFFWSGIRKMLEFIRQDLNQTS